MVDELAITNEIWRKWDEAKIIPPMTWAELRKKVEEYAKAGVVALDDFITLLEQKVTVVRAPPGSKKEWILRHPSEGAVSEEELRRRQKETIERLRSMGRRLKGVTFYFETRGDRDRAYELLTRHDFHFPYGPDFSLTDIDNPDYMLELLASEGFETSKILVERA
jgi:hypothetical protein